MKKTTKTRHRGNVHHVLDEAAALGHLSCIDDAVGMGRGYGIRLQFYFQSLGQTRKNFPDGQEQTLLSNTTQVFFAVNDQGVGENGGTADYVSNRLGEQTIIVDSGGSSSGSSWGSSSGRDSSTNSGRNTGGNRNWQQQARKLLKPEEVIALSPRVAITFTPGLPPIATRLIRYYEEKLCPGRMRRFGSALWMLVKAAILCIVSLTIAAALTRAVAAPARQPVPMHRPMAPSNNF